MKTKTIIAFGVLLSVGMVVGEDCQDPNNNPPAPPAGEAQVKASPTPSPSATPVSRSAM